MMATLIDRSWQRFSFIVKMLLITGVLERITAPSSSQRWWSRKAKYLRQLTPEYNVSPQ
jgi:hypothetical protein